MKEKKETRRKKAKKKNRKGAIVAISILVILVFVIIFIWSLIYGRLSKLNIVHIDKSDLDINESLQDEVKDLVSKDEFEDIVTIALFGSDSRDTSDMSAGRADSIIVASLNPKNKSIKLLSIPRDTYVKIPGYGYDKINHSYAYGGEQLLIKTINSNFGLAITEYATVDFVGLANIINALGGIDMEISIEERNVLNMYLKEIYSLEGKAYAPMTEYGKVTLNGEQAVAHCRNRYVGSDFSRAERQRNVITATINKAASMPADKVLGIVDVALEQVTTNIDVTSYLGKITNVVMNLGEYKNNIISAQVPASENGYDKMIDGIYYFAADLDDAKSAFISYIYGDMTVETNAQKEVE